MEMAVYLSSQLDVDFCPHCGKANPTLKTSSNFLNTKNHLGECPRCWGIYVCSSCGGVVTAFSWVVDGEAGLLPIVKIYPEIPTISDLIPTKPREFLQQAQNSLHAPAGAIMLSSSAIDAMLKEKNYKDGSLYDRIDRAAKEHLITEGMAQWAHQVRLEANDQRHADQEAPLPNEKDANLAFDFAVAFAEYLFVLPAKVSRGIIDSKEKQEKGVKL